MSAVTVTGAVGVGAVVATGARLARQAGMTPPDGWGPLLTSVDAHTGSVLPIVMILGVAALVAAWWRLARLAERGLLPLARLTVPLAIWAGLVVLAPPILSLDVYSYHAAGVMLVHGLDPYLAGPAALGHSLAVDATDPLWRHAQAPYGPLALWVVHAVAWLTNGDTFTAVLCLRLVACAGVAIASASVIAAANSRGGSCSAQCASALGPIVLLQLVGAVHLEALMLPLLAGGLLAVQRQRPVVGLVLLTAAAAVKWPALIAVAVVMAVRARRTPRRALVVVLGDGAVVAAAGGALSMLVPDGIGWLRAAATPTAGLTLYAPTTVVAKIAGASLRLCGATAPDATVLSAVRIVGMMIAIAVIGWLLLTVQRRDVAASAGWALLWLAVLGPVLYPWYLTWGIVPLAMVGGDRPRRAIYVGNAVGVFLALPHCELLFAGRPALVGWLSSHAGWMSGAAGAVGSVVIAIVVRLSRRAESGGERIYRLGVAAVPAVAAQSDSGSG